MYTIMLHTLYWYYKVCHVYVGHSWDLKVKYVKKYVFQHKDCSHTKKNVSKESCLHDSFLDYHLYLICCIMKKLRNLSILSVHKMKNLFELKICKDPIMQHICYICWATNVACRCQGGRGLIITFFPKN